MAHYKGASEVLAAATPSGILYLQKKKDKFEVNSNWEFSQNRSVVKVASHSAGLIAGYEDGSIELWQWPINEKTVNINQKHRISSRQKGDAALLSLSLSDD